MNILFFLTPKSELTYIEDDYSLRQTLEKMEFHKFSCVPILNKKGRYVGTISEGDILWYIKAKENLDIREASDVLVTRIPRKRDYKAVDVDTSMEELVQVAMQQNFVPVVDDQKFFIGIVTRKEIIGYCYKQMQALNQGV